jgi:hypothetical protein
MPPSIVPEDADRDVFLWRETDETESERATLLQNMLEGQYENPVRIVAFNTAKGWSRDVTEDIAYELRKLRGQVGETPSAPEDFLDDH